MSEARSIPFFNYPFLFKSEKNELLEIFCDVGERGAFILQKDVKEFEDNLAKFVDARFALGVANATDALRICLEAAGIGQGDEVILCSHTFVATASPLHFVGAKAVLTECGTDHLMDCSRLEQLISSKTRAIIPTQLNGRVCEMRKIMEIAKAHNLLVIEDAAQALGARYFGQAAGTFGIAGFISFYPAKSLGCLGDGGAIITNDETFYRKCFALRDHGKDINGAVVGWGFNSRLDNMHAAILNARLRRFPQVIERRRNLASIYHSLLKDLGELNLPPAPGSEEGRFDTFQNYEMQADRRDELVLFLKQQGIGTLLQWGGQALHQISGLGLACQLPYTDKVFKRCLMLPMNTSLSDDDVKYVAGCVREFFGYSKI